VRELHREPADATGRAGYAHPLAEERATASQRAESSQAGNRQGCGDVEVQSIRQLRHVVDPNGRSLGPGPAVHPPHDTGPRARAGPVGGLLQHDPCQVPPRTPAVLGLLPQREALPAVEGDRANLDQRLVRRGLRIRHIAELDAAGRAGCRHERAHVVA